MNYIINDKAMTVFLRGKTHRIEKTDPRFLVALRVFDLPEEEQDDAFLDILAKAEESAPTISTLAKKGFDVNLETETVSFEGETLPQPLVTKVLSIIRDGLPVGHFENFWKNLRDNPSSTAVNELMDFLSYAELPLTSDGCFLAYKGVNDDFWSIQGNTATRVIRGSVDSDGKIFNGVGEVIEVHRRDVDDDRRNECSHGLHVGSKDYAVGWGPRVVVVKINPKDVVSVPPDCQFQKCRVCKYEVIDFYEQEIKVAVTDECGRDTLDRVENTWGSDVGTAQSKWDAFVDRVETYLYTKCREGYGIVTVRQIQSIFSPEWPSREKVLSALQELGENIGDEDGRTVVYL